MFSLALKFWTGIGWDTLWDRFPSSTPPPLFEALGAQGGALQSAKEAEGSMPSKAVVTIQGLVASWLGEAHEAASEMAVTAELKRVRGELNKFRTEAGDAPLDQDRIRAEADEVIQPLVRAYVERFVRVRGVKPDAPQFSAEWDIYFAHLLAGTAIRNRYSYVLVSPLIERQLVDNGLVRGRGRSTDACWQSRLLARFVGHPPFAAGCLAS